MLLGLDTACRETTDGTGGANANTTQSSQGSVAGGEARKTTPLGRTVKDTGFSTDGQGQALGGPPPMLTMMLFYGDVLLTTEGHYDEPSNVNLLRHDD